MKRVGDVRGSFPRFSLNPETTLALHLHCSVVAAGALVMSAQQQESELEEVVAE